MGNTKFIYMNNQLTEEHYRRSLMGTNNTIFNLAITAPMNDKKSRYPLKLKQAMNWPDWLNCDFDVKNLYGVYDRLYQFTLISLCCDIEFFLKALFSSESLQQGNGRGYFQRFSSVVSDLTNFGVPLNNIQSDIDNIVIAFSIRHVAIHNFGLADEDYIRQTKSTLNIGDHVPVNQEIYLLCSGSYRNFLSCVDLWLVNRKSNKVP